MYILKFLNFQQEVHCVMAGVKTAAVLKKSTLRKKVH